MTVISTTSGRIRGEIVGGVHRFLAVPYAAAPEGELRFAAPRPSTWDGERDATVRGTIAPQLVRELPGVDLSALLGSDLPQGGNYLTADVYSPDPAAGSLPVMVFIHGGGFAIGTGSAPILDGTAFARRGVVLVSINYRLGIEGFLPLAGGETNIGLRDQLAALHWVRDNAAAFGGDPDNVTVFGESAGAMSIGCLLGSPLARGLFRRAILESGHADMVRKPEVAAAFADQVADRLGVPATAEAFREVTSQRFLDVQNEISLPGAIDLRDADGFDPSYRLTQFLPVLGDDLLPELPIENPNGDVDVLAGSNAEEMRLYYVPTGLLDTVTDEQALAIVGASRPDADEVLRSYGLGAGKPTGEVLLAAMTDVVFADGARRLIERHPGRGFLYRFEWGSPLFDGRLGACHGMELPFVFDTLDAAVAIVGPDAPRELAAEMNGAWVRFAETGDPGWAAGAVRSFG